MAIWLQFCLHWTLFLTFMCIGQCSRGQHIINLLDTVGHFLDDDQNIHPTDIELILSKFEQLRNRLSRKSDIGSDVTNDISPRGLASTKSIDVEKLKLWMEILNKAFASEKTHNTRSRRDVAMIKSRLSGLESEEHRCSEMDTLITTQNAFLDRLQLSEKYQANANHTGHVMINLQRQAIERISDIYSAVKQVAVQVDKIYGETMSVDQTKNKTSVPRSCRDLKNGKSGVYTVYPNFQLSGLDVYCNMEIDGGGWIVFQRRQDGFVDFFRNWNDYKKGFGDLNWEFWLGNDNIYGFTNKRSSEMRIDLVDENGNRGYAKYDVFKVGSEENKYELTVKDYSGNVGDALLYHNLMKFTTKDMDNDIHTSINCAVYYTGAWWYKNCHHSNLNGNYSAADNKGPRWYQWHKDDTRMIFQEMKLRWKY